MRLLLDVGNTRLKWRLVPDEISNARLPVGNVGPADGQANCGLDSSPAPALVHDGKPEAVLVAADRLSLPTAPREIWIANVMGAATEAALAEAARQRFGVAAHFVRSPTHCDGWTNAYEEPHRLGTDRFLAMLALWRRTRRGFCVASAGTALTFDAVDGQGRHLGGVIAPGLAAMLEATLGSTRFHTATLPDWPPASAGHEVLLGHSTEHCVQLGALHAAAGLLDRLHQKSLASAAVSVLAGGDAATLAPHLTNWQVAHDLVLEGLLSYVVTTANPPTK